MMTSKVKTGPKPSKLNVTYFKNGGAAINQLCSLSNIRLSVIPIDLEKPTKDFISFASFVSFFPQLVAGPIERANRLLPQFSKVRKFCFKNLNNAFPLILFGFFKSEVLSPVEGSIESISEVTGQIIMREAPIPVEIDAYMSGTVKNIIPNEGVTIQAHAAFIQGIFGIGGEARGDMEVLVKDRGSEIILHVSKDSKEFLEDARIRTLLSKYNKFMPIPIKFGTKEEPVEKDKDSKKDEKPKTKTVDNIINNPNPAWTKQPKELKDDDYIAWIGHATYLIKLGNMTIITDPVLSLIHI